MVEDTKYERPEKWMGEVKPYIKEILQRAEEIKGKAMSDERVVSVDEALEYALSITRNDDYSGVDAMSIRHWIEHVQKKLAEERGNPIPPVDHSLKYTVTNKDLGVSPDEPLPSMIEATEEYQREVTDRIFSLIRGYTTEGCEIKNSPELLWLIKEDNRLKEFKSTIIAEDERRRPTSPPVEEKADPTGEDG